MGRVGLGVFTTTDLDVGDVVGEYAGVLHEYEGLRKGQPHQALKHNSGYTMPYNIPSIKNKYVYVEALSAGSITQFRSHTFEPNAVYVELQHRAEVKLIARMI
ncbi:hypothetical protein PI124_g21432 [Phytophthora idaei]|nr:hypothetical protein PI125_g23066 [Phytophthora idaei]KAG3138679.1 hypothetical protein PI126_g16812 [Phytophthora idaei]KAG3233495.1 hypothetical protein PI124_g21432 [Phytophthora idaei]